MDDPTRDEAIDEVTRASSMPVKPMIACPTDIRAAIRVYYLGESVPEAPPPSQIAAPQASPLNHSGQRNVSLSAVAAPLRPIRGQGAVEAHSGVTQNPGMPQEGGTGAATAPDGSPPRRIRPRMISLTLLDGTTVSVPAPKRRGSKPDADQPAGEELSDQLTARDLVSALRAVAHGADASEILGTEPRWEAMFSALLSILLRRGLIADWEFIEEFRKI
jgi:type IV pilus assembly protein PilB